MIDRVQALIRDRRDLDVSGPDLAQPLRIFVNPEERVPRVQSCFCARVNFLKIVIPSLQGVRLQFGNGCRSEREDHPNPKTS
jgi:hypothetical protein